MVEFGTGYQMPMEREYGQYSTLHEHGGHGSDAHSTQDVGVSIGDFGMSLGLGPVPNVQAIKSKLHAGTKKLEFVFTGAGKGSAQGQTPEQYGLKQREALREIATSNKVSYTTHATVGVYGLAGMDQQGNFSKSSKTMSLNEIKRAIEFAADVARGGPVVVHTGEFQRPIIDVAQYENEEWKKKFQMYGEEAERAAYRVVDVRNGHLIQEARRNRRVAKPVWNRYDDQNEELWSEHGGQRYTDADGKQVKPGDYVDYQGKKLDPVYRVPRFDTKEGTFMVHQMDWAALEAEAKEMTVHAKEQWLEWKQGKMSEEKFDDSRWARFKNVKKVEEIDVRPEEAYIISTLETQAANSRGWAYYYGSGFEGDRKKIDKLEKALKFYKKLEAEIPEDEKWKIKLHMRESNLDQLVPEEAKNPSEWIEEEIRRRRHHVKQNYEASSSQWAQAAEATETIKHVESAETYAIKEAWDAYAQSAMFAMEQSKRLQAEGKLKKPLAIAMENLFPETYGAHPDELIKLVKGSRERMVELLKNRGVPEEEATRTAMDHITATFDTGHLNMWKKYWTGDPNKSVADNDAEFGKWMLTKIGDMVDAKILGHVHIDDNYGYQDDHLAPGEGNAPIKAMVMLLKEKGYKGELIVEPGADYYTDLSGFHSVMKTWRLFGSPVYGASGIPATKRNWNQVGYGWFGQNDPPYFTFGAYSPSEDWTMWSGVQLE